MAAHGTVTVYVYTSDAQIPLEGAAVTITRRLPDGAQELLGLRLTNFDGYTASTSRRLPRSKARAFTRETRPSPASTCAYSCCTTAPCWFRTRRSSPDSRRCRR